MLWGIWNDYSFNSSDKTARLWEFYNLFSGYWFYLLFEPFSSKIFLWNFDEWLNFWFYNLFSKSLSYKKAFNISWPMEKSKNKWFPNYSILPGFCKWLFFWPRLGQFKWKIILFTRSSQWLYIQRRWGRARFFRGFLNYCHVHLSHIPWIQICTET